VTAQLIDFSRTAAEFKSRFLSFEDKMRRFAIWSSLLLAPALGTQQPAPSTMQFQYPTTRTVDTVTKQNVFDDFISAAEYLIREKYTSSPHLAIRGGSNGGLLVGAVMTQRPDLFAAAIPQVGVMDMLRYDRFTAGAGWATEYGSSKDSTAFQYLRAYSPLHNIKPGVCYPATLVTTADHDDRVVPSHSFKFTATMQPLQAATPQCAKPVLIRIEAQGSHGYRPLDRQIREQADIWAFTAAHTGMTVRAPAGP
jgi:prolyl oligopeptidase